MRPWISKWASRLEAPPTDEPPAPRGRAWLDAQYRAYQQACSLDERACKASGKRYAILSAMAMVLGALGQMNVTWPLWLAGIVLAAVSIEAFLDARVARVRRGVPLKDFLFYF